MSATDIATKAQITAQHVTAHGYSQRIHELLTDKSFLDEESDRAEIDAMSTEVRENEDLLLAAMAEFATVMTATGRTKLPPCCAVLTSRIERIKEQRALWG